MAASAGRSRFDAETQRRGGRRGESEDKNKLAGKSRIRLFSGARAERAEIAEEIFCQFRDESDPVGTHGRRSD
jgi:hypothetical protein